MVPETISSSRRASCEDSISSCKASFCSGAEEGIIPATLGFDNGYWCALPAPVRVVVGQCERGQLHAYVVCQPASNYYSVMTHAEWMPSLVGEWSRSGRWAEAEHSLP